MLLIAAALEEELEAGLALCQDRKMIHGRVTSLWQAERNGKKICFLRTGFGPERSAASLDRALAVVKPAGILVIGYAGGLDVNLKLGYLVAVRRALAVSLDKDRPGWNHARIDDSFELADSEILARSAGAAGLTACTGDALTSAYVLGKPEHKALLYKKFQASIVDMETAALARVALQRSIPLSCVRAISDEVQDTFLAPFSHEPLGKIRSRIKRLMDAGMMQTFRQWRDHAAVARKSLSRFLSCYL